MHLFQDKMHLGTVFTFLSSFPAYNGKWELFFPLLKRCTWLPWRCASFVGFIIEIHFKCSENVFVKIYRKNNSHNNKTCAETDGFVRTKRAENINLHVFVCEWFVFGCFRASTLHHQINENRCSILMIFADAYFQVTIDSFPENSSFLGMIWFG